MGRYRSQEVRRSGLLLRNFSIKKLPPHKWPSQLTHSLADFFVKKIWKTFKKTFENYSTLFYSTLRMRMLTVRAIIKRGPKCSTIETCIVIWSPAKPCRIQWNPIKPIGTGGKQKLGIRTGKSFLWNMVWKKAFSTLNEMLLSFYRTGRVFNLALRGGIGPISAIDENNVQKRSSGSVRSWSVSSKGSSFSLHLAD